MTSFRNCKAIHLGEDKTRFAAALAFSERFFLQPVFGLRYRCSIRTTSISPRVRHEAVPCDEEMPGILRPRAERVLRLQMVRHFPKQRAISELFRLRLRDESSRSTASHTCPLIACLRNPTSQG